MEENLLPAHPLYKLYKDKAIYIGTFLGGPLVAGYLAAENFKQLGQQDRVKQSWLIAILATIIIFGGVFLIPDIENVPRYIIPLLYTLLAQVLVKKYQGAAIKSHIEAGGQMFSNWRAVWIGFIGLAVTFAVIFSIALFTNQSVF